MVVRMKITLEQTDFSELLKLALAELRTPESQLIYILRKEISLNNKERDLEDLSMDQDYSVCEEVSHGK